MPNKVVASLGLAGVVGITAAILVSAYGYQNKRFLIPLRKSIFGVDEELRYFVWAEFDAVATQKDVDEGLDYYIDGGKRYLTGSGYEFMNHDFVFLLDEVRHTIEMKYNNKGEKNIVFVINSAARSRHYNETLAGAASESSHIFEADNKTEAADISLLGYDNFQKNIILHEFAKAGINRFGIGENFVHVDTDQSKAPNSVWYYDSYVSNWFNEDQLRQNHF